jgi:hypothetical protein
MSDKMEIMGSPLGIYSLLRDDFIISILNDDGSLDTGKLGELLPRLANMGANALRDFFWIDSEDALAKIAPFWRSSDGSVRFNDQYFQHQRIIAESCNRCNMRYYLSIFDHCGTKISNRMNVGKFNPWRSFNDFFYGEDAKDVRHQLMDRVLDAFEGLDTGIELCNEPKSGHGLFLADTFIHLKNKGFDPKKIILGIDYHLKEKNSKFGKDYRDFRDKAKTELGNANWSKWLKTKCISPVHNATLENIEDLWGPNVRKGGDRRILYSMDGVQNPRPTKALILEIGKKVLKTKSEARDQQKVHFEIVYGKTKNDPMDTITGISEAYKEIWGEFPKNFGKFPNPIEIKGTGGEKSHNEWVVERGYLGLLGRPSDEGGEKGYKDFLDEGGSALDFCRKLIDSREYKDNRLSLPAQELATSIYQGILSREPDVGGLAHTIQMIDEGRVDIRATAMLESDEFKNRFC